MTTRRRTDAGEDGHDETGKPDDGFKWVNAPKAVDDVGRSDQVENAVPSVRSSHTRDVARTHAWMMTAASEALEM